MAAFDAWIYLQKIVYQSIHEPACIFCVIQPWLFTKLLNLSCRSWTGNPHAHLGDGGACRKIDQWFFRFQWSWSSGSSFWSRPLQEQTCFCCSKTWGHTSSALGRPKCPNVFRLWRRCRTGVWSSSERNQTQSQIDTRSWTWTPTSSCWTKSRQAHYFRSQQMFLWTGHPKVGDSAQVNYSIWVRHTPIAWTIPCWSSSLRRTIWPPSASSPEWC